jgi:hypothetical protein
MAAIRPTGEGETEVKVETATGPHEAMVQLCAVSSTKKKIVAGA